ncbi:hypothetical protein ABZZ74_23320 [Streptomyces sp. NPDC006476]|uniref:hypothetical protein n=1 Tax=Streptomyces sp. NPDC006476 TaxID=3157175 RepID=UPI0033B33D44
MARLQILELPEGSGDERPPYLIVVDQVPRDEPAFEALRRDLADNDIAARIGAQGVLVFEDAIDIPANETPLGPDGYPLFLRDAREPDGLRLAHERAGITRDMDRLAKWKNELLDALGMDRTRDWDDIRNAAAGLRNQRDAQGAAIERVRQLHKPVFHRGQEICWECSAYDFVGKTTDNAPIAYDQCATILALTGSTGHEPKESTTT